MMDFDSRIMDALEGDITDVFCASSDDSIASELMLTGSQFTLILRNFFSDDAIFRLYDLVFTIWGDINPDADPDDGPFIRFACVGMFDALNDRGFSPFDVITFIHAVTGKLLGSSDYKSLLDVSNSGYDLFSDHE